jgi:hypothetical protein
LARSAGVVLLAEEAAVDPIDQAAPVVERRDAEPGGGEQHGHAAAGQGLRQGPEAVLVEVEQHGGQRHDRQPERRVAGEGVLERPPRDELELEHSMHQHDVGGGERERQQEEAGGDRQRPAELDVPLHVGDIAGDLIAQQVDDRRSDADQQAAGEEPDPPALLPGSEPRLVGDHRQRGGQERELERVVEAAVGLVAQGGKGGRVAGAGDGRQGFGRGDRQQQGARGMEAQEDQRRHRRDPDAPFHDAAQPYGGGRMREVAGEAPQEQRQEDVERQGVEGAAEVGERTVAARDQQVGRSLAEGVGGEQEEAAEPDRARVAMARHQQEHRGAGESRQLQVVEDQRRSEGGGRRERESVMQHQERAGHAHQLEKAEQQGEARPAGGAHEGLRGCGGAGGLWGPLAELGVRLALDDLRRGLDVGAGDARAPGPAGVEGHQAAEGAEPLEHLDGVGLPAGDHVVGDASHVLVTERDANVLRHPHGAGALAECNVDLGHDPISRIGHRIDPPYCVVSKPRSQ